MMSKMQVLRALVAERLAAAAEEIFGVVERMITLAEKKLLHTSEMSPEQQRAMVHKRLTVVAEEIFRILEMMMGGYEAEVSRSYQEIDCQRKILDITLKTETKLHRADALSLSGSACEKEVPPEQQQCERRRSPNQAQKNSDLPQIKEAPKEVNISEFIQAQSSHQTQRAEKGISTKTMETDPEGECFGASELPSDQEALSSSCSEAGSEDKDSDEELNEKPQSVKTKKTKTFKRLRNNQGTDCCEMCGRSFSNGLFVKNMQKHKRKIGTRNNRSQSPGQSCCRVCGKFFRYKRSFLKHVLKHEQNTDLCGVCGKHLDSDESLRLHLETHNEENICRDETIVDEKQSEADCSEAESEAGNSDEDWKESEGTETDDGDSDKDQTKAGPCLKKLKSKKVQVSNKQRAKIKECGDLSLLKYCCKVCGKSFCYRASFLKHVQEEEKDTDLCGVCGKQFESKESLRLHLQTYIRTNDCEVCGKHFDGHRQLEMHIRTHTGEKPYVCAVCGKSFAQNGNLMGHMRVHTGEKPYVCSVCGQGFSFKEYMMAHMRIHTGEKPFLCSICGKGFRQRGTLKTHMMIHTGESTHSCSICDKKFYKSGALKIHMRTHTGEKPYLCNVCGKCFTASGSLTKHMGVHEGEWAHSCSVCGKGFLRKEDLKRHVQIHKDQSTQLTCL